MKKSKRLIFILAFFLVLIIGGILGYTRMKQPSYYTIEPRIEKVEQKKKDSNNIIGWLRVQGTNIDVPVIHAETEEDFKNRDYKFSWTGNNEEKLTNRVFLSGHNLMNLSSQPMKKNDHGVGFEDLMGFVYQDVADQNKYIQYTIGGQDYLYKIFSVSVRLYIETGFEIYHYSEKEMKDYIKKVRKDSYYDYDVDVNEKDSLLTLITCTRMFGVNQQYVIQIDGRLLRKNEKPTNYSQKPTKAYEKIKQNLEGEDENEQTL